MTRLEVCERMRYETYTCNWSVAGIEGVDCSSASGGMAGFLSFGTSGRFREVLSELLLFWEALSAKLAYERRILA